MYVNPAIFKAYDIRGVFPDEINAKTVYLISRAFAEYLRKGQGKDAKQLRVVVGSDARASSPELVKAITEGLLAEGVNVINIGLVTTPLHFYAVVKTEADGGIMVTAAHAAYHINGMKLCGRAGEPINTEGMNVIKNISSRAVFSPEKKDGIVTTQSPVRDYIEFLVSQVDLSGAGRLRIVVDAGGGMTGLLLPLLVKRLPCVTIMMNTDLIFTIGTPTLDPAVEERLAALKNAVIEQNADFGAAFNSDGDRIGFVTHNARFFRADYAAAFLARELLKKNPAGTVVHDIRSSSILRETIARFGGRAVESRVGHSFIKETMKKENALFGSELSGHFYFKSTYFMDSDLLPFLYFLQFLAENTKTSDELLEEFEVYSTSGELSFKINEKRNETLLEEVSVHFKDAKNIKWIDGLTIYYDDWWANIRQSNTETTLVIRLIVEARTKELLDSKVAELKALITT